MAIMHKYEYSGPVMEFDNCVSNRWVGTTWATSEARAKTNLTYQFKQRTNRSPGTKISLPGKLKLVD